VADLIGIVNKKHKMAVINCTGRCGYVFRTAVSFVSWYTCI